MILPTLHDFMPARLGLTRAQSVFDHPILFGLCTGGILGLVHLVLGYRQSFFQRSLRAGIVGVTAMLSLSSGPMFALITQGLLLSWNSLLGTIKARWKVLIALVVLVNLSVVMFSNRSLPTIVSNNIALDEQTYWFRTMIWTYGSTAALNHPLFGVGMNEWARPAWMGPSIDNLWLCLAVQYGLPAVFFLTAGYFVDRPCGRYKKGAQPETGRVSNRLFDCHDGVCVGRMHRTFLGHCLGFLPISDGQRRLDTGCKSQGEGRHACAGCFEWSLRRHVTAMGSKGVVHTQRLST